MTYIVRSVEGNRQRLDGGAMFGNVPRAVWEKWIAPDERNRIELACRSFLFRDVEKSKLILLEAGIGAFFEPKLQDRFGVLESGHQLLRNLAQLDVLPEQIEAVVLSHLHFDHAGGLLSPWRPDGSYELVFPNARFIVGKKQWERALSPHLRDRASYITLLMKKLKASGRLELIEEGAATSLGPDFFFHRSDGHTPGMLLAEIRTPLGAFFFTGDLIPGEAWLHLPVTMGYDRFPELLVDEKQKYLGHCHENGVRLLMTHDPCYASCRVSQDEKGRYIAEEKMENL